jgi:hypothetical protein
MTASRTKNESFDYIMRSPHYLFSKSQLNHLFVENEYFAEMWHNENFLTVRESQLKILIVCIIMLFFRFQKMWSIQLLGD